MSTPSQKPTANREIQIFPDVNAIARRAAELIVESAAAAVKQNGRFTISLAGGSTPKTLYALLAAEPYFRPKCPGTKPTSSSATSATSLPTIPTATSAWPTNP